MATLFVDDSRDIRFLAAKLFELQGITDVHFAVDVSEAEQIIDEVALDCAVIDMEMGSDGGAGWKVVQYLMHKQPDCRRAIHSSGNHEEGCVKTGTLYFPKTPGMGGVIEWIKAETAT